MESIDRRRFLKKTGVTAGAAGVAGAVWISPVAGRFLSPAVAASGTVGNVGLYKATSGNNTLTGPAELCVGGSQATNVDRGSVTFTRTENPATISVTISISSGPSNYGREVYIMQSNSSSCMNLTTSPVGSWAASPLDGPQTFSTPIVAGATHFVVVLWKSGGGGTDASATTPVALP